MLVLPNDVETLEACETPAQIQDALFAIASRARDAKSARNQLREALMAEGQPSRYHLEQIWGSCIRPPGKHGEGTAQTVSDLARYSQRWEELRWLREAEKRAG